MASDAVGRSSSFGVAVVARVPRHRRHHRHHGVVPAEPGDYVEHLERRRDRVRRRCGRSSAAAQPLLELQRRRATYSRKARDQASSTGGSPADLHVLAWDPDEEKLARFGVPFWLLRLKIRADSLQRLRFGIRRCGVNSAGGHREVRAWHHPRYDHAGRRARPLLGAIDR